MSYWFKVQLVLRWLFEFLIMKPIQLLDIIYLIFILSSFNFNIIKEVFQQGIN